VRILLKLNPGYLASHNDPASLSQLKCNVWAGWSRRERLRYSAGLAHGMRWWMLWEKARVRNPKTKNAWSRARDAISGVDIEKGLFAYCREHPSDDFLSGLVRIMWRVAHSKGAPIRAWKE